MQIKTIMRYHHIPVSEWQLSERQQIPRVTEDMKKRGPFGSPTLLVGI